MNNPHLEYTAAVESLLDGAAQRRQPAHGVFELTSRCNLSCSMCYVRHPARDHAVRQQELSAEAWGRLAHQAADAGMVFLLVTGGEVFVRPDFFDIYEPLTRMGLIIRLFTNGTLITDRVAERLAAAPPNHTAVTLYGATAEAYEAVTGVPGSYARCCDGIEALLSRGIPLGLKATIVQRNLGELEAMRQMARNWGVGFAASGVLSKRADGQPSEVESCRVSATDCVLTEAGEVTPRNTSTGGQTSSPDGSRSFFCRAGRASFHVNSVGEMGVCPDLLLPAAKPLEIGFANAWARVQQFVESVPSPDDECLACSARTYCPRCPAWSLLETGTMTEPVPYLCQIAQARSAHHDPRT